MIVTLLNNDQQGKTLDYDHRTSAGIARRKLEWPASACEISVAIDTFKSVVS